MARPPADSSSLPSSTRTSRRDFLWQVGGGIGGVALSQLLGQDRLLAATAGPAAAARLGGVHHPARAKRVLQIFLNGGMSQMDTFDHKPRLAELHGKTFDPGAGAKVESVTGSGTFPVLKSPFEWKQHGQSGRWVSSVFPHLARHVDEMAFLMSMTSRTNVHGPGAYMMNTGFTLPGFPSMGAWVSYALGSVADNLPAFVVMPDPRGLPYNNLGNFTSAFLPVAHAGTIIRAGSPTPINDLFPPQAAKFVTGKSEADGLALLDRFNRAHAQEHEGDSRLDARIASYELAARMQLSAPEVLDIASETAATRVLYGLDEKITEDFGKRCLIARRMLERGVRVVQVWSGAAGPANNWDNHNNVAAELPAIASQVDKPTAGLLADLKSRGMLDDTLVLFNTEFGRQPFSQNQGGRDHNGGTFVGWMAGGGTRAGASYGQSDEWGWKSLSPASCYDFHATVLHLLGIEHERLTFRHNGVDRRLTDVHGDVIRQVIA